MNYIKHWIWFVKQSRSFMGKFYWISFIKAFSHAKLMCKWDKMTSAQQEAWYASGEGRTIDF